MSRARYFADHLQPWSGWIAALIGWGVTQQVGSIAAQDKCAAAGPVPILLLGLVGLAVLAGGALLSLRLWRRKGETATRRFLAAVGMMLAAVTAAAVVWQTLAALIIPECFG